MRVKRSSSAAATATLMAWLVPLVSSISVPTGKLTPITPARPTPRPVNPRALSAPAPVVEYSQDHPEPPPLDPSYVPQTFNYFDTLARHHIYYYPVRYRNFNALSNQIEYEPPQKFISHTLGKNFDYKPFKQHLALPYFPVRHQPVDWSRDNYNNQVNNQYNEVDSQPGADYNNQYNNQNNVQAQNQYNGQPMQQQQQYEAVSTQSSPASTGTPQSSTAPQATVQMYPKVDYSSGKGSYDVTGKGGSKSEYYTKDDWSKKTLYPKKALSTTGKFASHKY